MNRELQRRMRRLEVEHGGRSVRHDVSSLPGRWAGETCELPSYADEEAARRAPAMSVEEYEARHCHAETAH
jgi:hypothetical protein